MSEKRVNYQSFEPCTACGEVYLDRCYHHIITQKTGGPDTDWNLLSVCLKHHNDVHDWGMRIFSIKFPKVITWLVNHDWLFDKFYKQWVRRG